MSRKTTENSGFELALVRGCVMGKAKVNHLAVGVAPLSHERGQVIENDRQV
jgi:hypothetical protein